MTNTVEAVARAITRAMGLDPDAVWETTWSSGETKLLWERQIPQARAAIKAHIECLQDNIDRLEGNIVHDVNGHADPRAVRIAMLEQAERDL